MKKFLSLILAILMIFSVSTAAFAADTAEGNDTEVTAPAEDDGKQEVDIDSVLETLENIPWGAIKPAAKVLKILAKLLKVFFKIAIILDLDVSGIAGAIKDVVDNAQNQGGTEAPTEPAAPMLA